MILSSILTKGTKAYFKSHKTLERIKLLTTFIPSNSSSTTTTEMNKFKVLIANDTVPEIAANILKTECDVVICTEEKEDILKNISGMDGLFWASYKKLDEDILDKAGTQLKAIATMSAGYNNIDVEQLRRRNIKFGNTPGIVGNAVAEQAVMLALAASRRLNEGRIAIENAHWCNKDDARWLMGMEISGSTVGIVGLGSIGQAIKKKLKGFEVEHFLYTGHKPKAEGTLLGAEFVTLDHLVRNSDFIFACVPLTKETENLFDYSQFSKMKKSTVFVNVGRGNSVKQDDLIKALKANLIFAAGLDVMTPEPLSPDDELLKIPNCIISPHLGTSTWKTTNKMAELAARNLLLAVRGEPMLTPVL